VEHHGAVFGWWKRFRPKVGHTEHLCPKCAPQAKPLAVRSVRLKSGAGQVKVSAEVDLFALSVEDRAFIDDIRRCLDEYESGAAREGQEKS
jgi:hypothetical protein